MMGNFFKKIIVDTLKHEINKICTILRSLTLFLTFFIISVNSTGYKLGLPVLSLPVKSSTGNPTK